MRVETGDNIRWGHEIEGWDMGQNEIEGWENMRFGYGQGRINLRAHWARAQGPGPRAKRKPRTYKTPPPEKKKQKKEGRKGGKRGEK